MALLFRREYGYLDLIDSMHVAPPVGASYEAMSGEQERLPGPDRITGATSAALFAPDNDRLEMTLMVHVLPGKMESQFDVALEDAVGAPSCSAQSRPLGTRATKHARPNRI